ncbi:unnamed protein product [Rotaria sp. Silwood1]|nr:unnamed protein product [Rotaria sp. Silwood1]
MAVNHLNEIISLFLQWNVKELSDNDLSTGISNNGKTCSAEEVRHTARLLGSSLFQFRYNEDNVFLIRIAPTINICKDFLAGKCTFKAEGCNQLHLCRRFGSCNTKNCHFPHDFTHGNNRRIVEQSNCQNVNPILLVRLIRLNKQLSRRLSNTSVIPRVISKTPNTTSSSVEPKQVQQVFKRNKHFRSRRKSRGDKSNTVTDGDNTTESTVVSSVLDTNCQINISFPSKSITSHITIDEIVDFLRLQGVAIQKVFNAKKNERFHQCTLQFQEQNVVDNLLTQSRIPYEDVDLKFKRTNPLIDQKRFILKSTIDSKRGPISMEKFSLYIDVLTNHCSFKLTNLSSSVEQFLLVQCENIIDFDQLRRVQKSRRQLQGTDIVLKQIYELEAAFIESNNNPLSIEIIENMVEPVFDNVFIFTVESNRTGFVEFIDGDSLKKWLADSDTIQQKFDVNIKLDVRCVNKDEDICSNNAMSRSSNGKLSSKTKEDGILPQMTIYLRSQWTLVTNHPKFSIEYKNYIRSELGFEIEIRGNRIEIHHNSITAMLAKQNPSEILANRTHNFMRTFAFRSIILQQSVEQLKIFHEHSNTVAFCHIKDNNYNLATKKSNIENNGWVKITNAVHVIQHHFNVLNIKCVCQQQVSPLAILVHYIDKEHIEFGVDEQIIDGLCRKTLVLAKCTSATFEKEWESLKMKIYIRDDYGKDICLFDEQQTITLFGLPEVVKNVQQLFEDKKPKYIPPIVKNELNKPETSVQPSQSTIHQEDKQIKKQIVQTFSIAFDVDEPGFEILANRDCNQLLNIVGSKCQLEKQIIYHKIQIQIPKVRADHFNYNTLQSQSQENTSESTNDVNNPSANSNLNWFQRLFQRSKSKTQSSTPVKQQNSTPQVQATSSATNITSIAIGNSKIIVCTGDLTKQAVDIIVVCSTSGILRDAIISAAGQQVKTVYNQQPSNSILGFETTGGNLPCKKIVFRPWMCNKNQTQNLKPSIITFVQSVISFALHHKLTTIAFPSIGCGQLGFDPKLIAEYMIGETYEQFKNTVHSTLIVSFVLLPGQKNVYDAFTDRLNKIQMIDDKPTSISFDKQIVRIKLTGSNNSQLIEYRNTIKQLAQSCSLKLHLTDKTDMTDWSQDTIQRYYDYCLHRQVIPKLDLQNSTLDLIGPKDAVTDAEKYFFQLTAEILRNARIQVLTRGCIWSVEISSGQWEQYPFRINELIENAQLKKLPYIEFENEKSEKCRIIFSSMEEECQKRKRKVCRKRIDSTLPQYWDLSGDYFKRVVLLDSSNEYKDVLNRFDSTMKGNYSKIMKIERIQNERWYKQYAAHRDEFTQRYTQPDERLLFHGCSSESADKIVQECFNRAFAGANVMYGQGVYFHEHSKYSHSYAKASTSNERTMFLARVLIGKTCLGNSSMKVPPKSFDTTTDGGYIFVIYHDAGAYGEYLITYR